ncbi:MAG: hypothetical protein ACFFAU_13850 [Candidatus Hodarchaeota archaeon]
MWLDFDRKKINLKTYLEETMQGVFFRHLNNILGLRIQLSMTYDQFKSVGLKTIRKNLLSIIKQPFLLANIRNFSQSYVEGENPKPEDLTEEIFHFFLDETEEQLNFMNLLPDEEIVKQKITRQVITWVNKSENDPNTLLLEINQIWQNLIQIPRIFTDPEGNVKNYSKEELKTFWMYFFGGGSDFIQVQTSKLESWDDNQAHQFYKEIKKKTKYPDFVILQLLEFSSYEHAFIDAVTSFEDWLAFYFGIIAKKQPERFLNTDGIYSGFHKQMKEIIVKYHQSENPNADIVQEIIHQERINVGFAGKYLKKYITEHAKFEILIEGNDETFDYYTQLRIHRNNLVHPEPLEKSNILFPRSLDRFKEIIQKLTELGTLIISSCQILET